MPAQVQVLSIQISHGPMGPGPAFGGIHGPLPQANPVHLLAGITAYLLQMREGSPPLLRNQLPPFQHLNMRMSILAGMLTVGHALAPFVRAIDVTGAPASGQQRLLDTARDVLRRLGSSTADQELLASITLPELQQPPNERATDLTPPVAPPAPAAPLNAGASLFIPSLRLSVYHEMFTQ